MQDTLLSRLHLGFWESSLAVAICSVVLFSPSAGVFAADERPNIIVIMADDMGFSDIGPYGGEIHTPALDDLAKNGVRFTQFYNTARCCPTRAALLSGLYPHQAGVGWMMSDNGHDGYRGELSRDCVTIAEALKPAGYSTYMSGKWHVTKDVRADGDKSNWPRQRGFEKFFGTIHGAGSFFDPNSLTLDNTQIAPKENFYYTDAISDHAVKFIKEHDKSDPYFMYVAYTAPHWPMHALPEDIERYRGRYDTGWDALRGERFSRQKKMGLINQNWTLTDRDHRVPVWPEEKNKPWNIRRMEVYAAMIDRMDFGIGRIVNTLREKKQLDNTLILFLADNGGCAEEHGSNGPVKPSREQAAKIKAMADGELQTRMQPLITRDGKPVMTGKGVMPGAADTYVAYGKGWANASNTPFRMYKHWVHEGGISSPLIAHWPKNIKRKGAIERQPSHLIDIMATCVDVSQTEYPAEFGGNKITPLEGVSLVPAFAGKDIGRKDLIYWEHEGNRAVRDGKWKLVAKSSAAWELYDIEKDRTETNNLAASMPKKVAQLSAQWEAWAKRADVYPLTPYYNRSSAKLSKKKMFKLKSGEDLPKEKSPVINGKSFTIKGNIDASGDDGVIIAQGGTAHGFSVYLKDRKLQFASRIDGKIELLSSEKTVPKAGFRFDFAYQKDGKVSILIDGSESLSGKVTSGLSQMPLDGLQVGSDKNGAVGQYEAPHELKMNGSLVLEIQ